MLDTRKIRLMTRMATYEKKNIQKDLRISTYYKKDYASLNTLITILWLTVGYALLVGMFGLCYVDQILENLTLEKLFLLGGMIVGIYLVLLIVYGVCANTYYKGMHNRAKHRVKRYYRDLSMLEKMNEKEKRRYE